MKKIREIKQNTDDWHIFRQEGIGASEANIIMGKSKFKTPLQLWKEKVYGERSDDKSESFITNKGHKLESIARPIFEMEKNSDFPDIIAMHPHLNWLRASLDGYSEELNEVWECKFVGQDDFEKVKNGIILEQYYPQLQHQLLVTGASCNNLFVIADDPSRKGEKFPYKTACVQVPVDLHYIENDLFPALSKFWESVNEKKEPIASDNDVIDLSGNEELLKLLNLYNNIKTEIANIEKMEKDIKTKIFKIAKYPKSICNGIKITKSKSEDSVGFDYKKYEDDHGIPEGYTKITKGRITERITYPKEN